VAFVALLDANVLWGAALRDTLVRAALRELYRPAWTTEILAEVATSIKRRRPDLEPARIDRMVQLLREHLPEALIDGYEALVPTMTNDPKDRHVLAAAVRAGAQIIVTYNGSDFPKESCEPYNIEVQHPDEFLCQLWDLSPDGMAQVLRQQATPLRAPPQTPIDVAQTLRRSVPRFADRALASGLL
jgi:predicted nucleic acid-binding protein